MNDLVNGSSAPFDFSALGLTRTEEGAPMTIRHPKTGTPVLDEDKNPITITLLGQYSNAFRETLRAIQIARVEFSRNAQQINPGNPEPIPQEQIDQEDTDTLVACTTGWAFRQLDGQAFPCNPRNARKLYSDRRFWWLRQQAMNFILADGNFLADGSTTSSALPATVSAS